MPPLRRHHVPKLLKIVRGAQHACADNHEEESGIEQEGTTTAMAAQLKDFEDRLSASPISSDDEAPAPVKQPSPPPQRIVTAPAFKSGKSRTMDTGSTPGKRKSKRQMKPILPPRGAFDRSQADKNKRKELEVRDEEKENSNMGPSAQPMFRKKSAELEDDGPRWRSEFPALKRLKKIKYTANIHSAPADKAANHTKQQLRSGVLPSRTSTAKKPITFSRKERQPDLDLDPIDDEDDSDSELAELTKLTPRKKEQVAYKEDEDEDMLSLDFIPSKKSAKDAPEPPSGKTARPDLLDQLANFRKDQTLATSPRSGSPHSTLPNFDPHTSGNSTPLSSLSSLSSEHPAETIHALEQYLAEHSTETTDASEKCALCEDSIDPEHYTSFWAGKEKNVFLQTLFCKEHKKRKALEEYKKKGYPQIDWDAFPGKVREYNSQLIAVLRDERPSHYRDVHAQRLADREERTVRKLLDSDAIFESTTGYYGSRGKRAMMEAITTQLHAVIKECVERDSVVAFNGFANFVQAVLVPELTVWMVMDELEVSEAKAKEIVEESGALGEAVNEEVEDRVDVVESEDESEPEEDRSFDDED
ncbi:hypothetical protein K505DRAFT_327230 [Melanomma pulvis-pyrius CBS 109.77]|uniref:Restriction of telomere capping protein 4 n=1 Tax=Melanomma pulvis-pyrius CBS 109.77 TaxID=1314802 RepID=A0A6A6X3N2_9PLEO|nr:hypothetical protein K505DRAFT_327230 [Melanomma pulvis-pyrius CBS 109.77]